ncbi:uncharacterized protein LOC121416652 [Lytechinus variegatus]|uniref:uncharacterized protein LOC121416635 n=1 Tax=Lytechinus variegatus TaxID=7654 RepID=UPI001BB23E3E|nr:uncharacterized protein LOC121416635 [Lytechinus variegatus]XP_041466065.1 uncharacterized protein LOC121416652 [Lytechinus variegatus]
MSSATKVACLVAITLMYTTPLFGFVVNHKAMTIEPIDSSGDKFDTETSNLSTTPEFSSRSNGSISVDLQSSSLHTEENVTVDAQRDQPIRSSDGAVHTARKRSAECREPSTAALEVQLQLFRSGFVTTEAPTGAFAAGENPLTYLTNLGIPLFWDGEDCRLSPISLRDVFPMTNIDGRAACPWKLVQNSSQIRYPRDLLFAQCACRKCTSFVFEEFSEVNSCIPLVRDEHVLKKTGACVDGEYVYEPVMEPIPFACACIRPRTRPGNMNSN